MTNFESLFGIQQNKVKKLCVLTPFLSKGLLQNLEVTEFIRGRPFSAGQNQHFTLIHTHMGAPQAGDAVLCLQDTPCQKLILIGACGLVQRKSLLDLGSLVAPAESCAFESFSQFLEREFQKPKRYAPAKSFLNSILKTGLDYNIVPVTCATVGSIKLEEKRKSFFLRNKIDVVDMECSAFFCAAKYIHRRAAAVLYVTDILGKNDPFDKLSLDEHNSIQTAQKAIARLTMEIAEE